MLFKHLLSKSYISIQAIKRGQSTMSASVKVIPNEKLFVSEPNPMWFGNGPNPSNDAAWTNKNWLKSRFHFSFAEYSNPFNSRFGVMRVMNDDVLIDAVAIITFQF